MSLLVIGLIWLAIVVLVLGMLRAAAIADQAASRDAGAAQAPGPADALRLEPAERARRVHGVRPARWLAVVVSLTLAALSAVELGADAAVTAMAIGGGACACLLGTILERRRQAALIARQPRELGLHRAEMLGLSLRLLALRDPAAARHAAAVAYYARSLARAAGGSDRQQQIVQWAGLLHDIGRQRFTDRLLAHRGPLNDADRRAIDQHPLTGAALLRTVAGLDEVASAVEAHHERLDGTGYPHALRDEEIPRTARILAIAEVYDVLTAPDSYRVGGDHDPAVRELRRVAGTQLDPQLVELFVSSVSPRRHPPTLDEELATRWPSVELIHSSAPER